jgi:hypothetical protein
MDYVKEGMRRKRVNKEMTSDRRDKGMMMMIKCITYMYTYHSLFTPEGVTDL